MKKPGSASWFSYLGIALVVVSYAGALINMFRIKGEQEWGGKKVIRISHWQLESGFREAFDWVIAEYEKRNPDVKVIQLTVADKAYKQFMITQLIGGTAPDIIEMGRFTGGRDNITARFFYPLGEYVAQPNRYNEDNELAGMPWINTFKHQLEWNWDGRNLDYFTIGITGVSHRLVYNKTLMQRITGRDEPPATFREFITFCEQVKRYSDSTGNTIYPIAAARYQIQSLLGNLSTEFLHNYGRDIIERNFDVGDELGLETFLGWLEGRFDYSDPEIRASREIIQEILPFMEPGFMAKDRQDAAFSFAQQKSLIIFAGSWDMNSLVLQARESGSELGVMRLPLPDKSDSVYGEFIDGHRAESKDFNMPFGVCRFSSHPDVAIDFLRFYSSQKIAEEFCRRCGWLCSIRGTKNIDFIDGFEPQYLGEVGNLSFGNETSIFINQVEWEYLAGKIDYDEMMDRFRKRVISFTMKDINGHLQNFQNSFVPTAHTMSDASLRLHSETDPGRRDKLMLRLISMNDSYAGGRASLQASVYQMLETASLDNPRTRELRGEHQYKLFVNEFPNIPVESQEETP